MDGNVVAHENSSHRPSLQEAFVRRTHEKGACYDIQRQLQTFLKVQLLATFALLQR